MLLHRFQSLYEPSRSMCRTYFPSVQRRIRICKPVLTASTSTSSSAPKHGDNGTNNGIKGHCGMKSKASQLRTKALLDRIIRVDHAGELGADRIYAGQYAVLKNTSVGPVVKEMWEQEKVHLSTFEKLIPEHRVRPTVMLPLWNVAAFALGAGTALMGKEAAMACTVAVETAIGEHYNSQIRELIEDDPDLHKELLETISQFRDEELHHLETGLHHDAEQAPLYSALSQVIQVGCKAAIWVSERV